MVYKPWTLSTCLLLLSSMILSKTSGIAIPQNAKEPQVGETGSTLKNADLPGVIGEIHTVNYTSVVLTVDSDELRSFNGPSYRARQSIFDNVNCVVCNAGIWGAQALITVVKSGLWSDSGAMKTIGNSIQTGCEQRLSSNVCRGIIQEFLPQIYYILKNTDMGAKNACSFVMSGDCEYVPNPLHEWTVKFPPIPKPPVVGSISKKEGKKLKVLQLSDLHYDPYYHAGSNANCGNPLCCRSINGPPSTASDAAGKWGDYRNCDTPKITIDHMYKHIRTIHPDLDYILWTGDLPPHDIWNQTREGNLAILRATMEDMMKAFPNVTIFPALGNHESAPVNSFPSKSAPSEFTVSWLYEELHEQWKRWLPAETSNTVKRGGFYSVLVRPGFRIISVNTNYCNDKNFWLLINSTDPSNELQWLIDELQGAENRREKVHVIGHIPPGSSECLKIWSANYYRIINRYESTIVAQFFGHTHFDEFEVFYDTLNLTRPVSVAYVAPSVTPYGGLNPGYRIYYVDGDVNSTGQVIDHETWSMNLQKANVRGFPTWKKLYSARRDFGMKSLAPKEWDALLDRMIEDPDTFNQYYKYYYKNSPVRPTCDVKCRRQLLCDIRSGRSRDESVLCRKIDKYFLPEESRPSPETHN